LSPPRREVAVQTEAAQRLSTAHQPPCCRHPWLPGPESSLADRGWPPTRRRPRAARCCHQRHCPQGCMRHGGARAQKSLALLGGGHQARAAVSRSRFPCPSPDHRVSRGSPRSRPRPAQSQHCRSGAARGQLRGSKRPRSAAAASYLPPWSLLPGWGAERARPTPDRLQWWQPRSRSCQTTTVVVSRSPSLTMTMTMMMVKTMIHRLLMMTPMKEQISQARVERQGRRWTPSLVRPHRRKRRQSAR
jgi:hypothetical protein